MKENADSFKSMYGVDKYNSIIVNLLSKFTGNKSDTQSTSTTGNDKVDLTHDGSSVESNNDN